MQTARPQKLLCYPYQGQQGLPASALLSEETFIALWASGIKNRTKQHPPQTSTQTSCRNRQTVLSRASNTASNTTSCPKPAFQLPPPCQHRFPSTLLPTHRQRNTPDFPLLQGCSSPRAALPAQCLPSQGTSSAPLSPAQPPAARSCCWAVPGRQHHELPPACRAGSDGLRTSASWAQTSCLSVSSQHLASLSVL